LSSRPAKTRDEQNSDHEPISTLIKSLPALFGLSSTPAPPISSSDIKSLFPSDDISITSLIIQVLIILWNTFIALVPITFVSRFTISSDRLPEYRKLQARINLALCALSWDLVIGIWHLKRDNARLTKAVEEGTGLKPDLEVSKPNDSQLHEQGTVTPKRSNRKRESPRSEITKLERRRGASPPPLDQTPESSPSPTSSSTSSDRSIRRSAFYSLQTSKRITNDPRYQPSQVTLLESSSRPSGIRTSGNGQDQQAQPGPSAGSESERFAISPRKRDTTRPDYEKISKWYSRSPRRSSDSSSSSESDHLPTPYQVPVSLPQTDFTPTPENQVDTPTKPIRDADRYAFSYKSDRWLIDDCTPGFVEEEVTGLMSIPIVAGLVEYFTSFVIVVPLIMMVGMYWLDPDSVKKSLRFGF
jgi:hypothetical protein